MEVALSGGHRAGGQEAVGGSGGTIRGGGCGSTTVLRNCRFAWADVSSRWDNRRRPATSSSRPATWTRCGSAPTPESTRRFARWPPSKRRNGVRLARCGTSAGRERPGRRRHPGRRIVLRARPLHLRGKLPAGAGCPGAGRGRLARNWPPRQAGVPSHQSSNVRGIAGTDRLGRISDGQDDAGGHLAAAVHRPVGPRRPPGVRRAAPGAAEDFRAASPRFSGRHARITRPLWKSRRTIINCT